MKSNVKHTDVFNGEQVRMRPNGRCREMKLKGTDEDRTDIAQRYLRSGVESLHAGGTRADAEGFVAFAGAPFGAEAARVTGPHTGGVAGDQGTGRGSSVAPCARGSVAATVDSNDNESASQTPRIRSGWAFETLRSLNSLITPPRNQTVAIRHRKQ